MTDKVPATVTKVTEFRYTHVCPGFVTEVLYNHHNAHGRLIVDSVKLNDDKTFDITINVVERLEEVLDHAQD